MMNVGTILDDILDVTEQQCKSSSPENDTDAEGAKISKNGSDDDITIAKSSHDKEKTEVQWSNNGLFENDHELEKTNENNKALKKANDLLTKELKTYKKKLLKDQLLEVTLAEDVKNLVITSCVEIGNKNLQDEIERFSQESKDVLNESKTADRFCKDAFDVIEELSKRIVDLEKDLSKLEAKNDSSSSSIAESHISELEKESGENNCENAKCDLQTKIVELEKVLNQQTKDFDDVKLELSNRTIKFEAYFGKIENTKFVLERQLARTVDDSKAEKDQILKEINYLRAQLENLKGKFVETKVSVQKDLSKPVTAQSLPKNEKDQVLKRIASLESKLASQDIRSCQKEYHELRTSYNALKVRFDSLNRTKRKNNIFNSSKPKVNVSEKVHTGESSNPFFEKSLSVYNLFFAKR
ncbi:hypothetical protein Tco_0529286 [Tanacetum coccineum]